MKKIAPLLLAMLFISTGFSSGDYSDYKPVFMSREMLNKSVSYSETPRDLVNAGKIYTKSGYLYINERYKGIHVINNTDPANPRKVGFIQVPGCLDMAVKDNVMYVDNSTDMVAIDMDTKKVTKRIEKIFPEPGTPNGHQYFDRPDGDFVIVEWIKK